jgi:hypothetical protein
MWKRERKGEGVTSDRCKEKRKKKRKKRRKDVEEK